MITSDEIKQWAYEAGFDLCGIVSPDVIPEAKERLERWLVKGYHAEMEYMSKDTERRSTPSKSMPLVQSIIMLGINYYQPDSSMVPPSHGRVSKYARGRDYHKVITKKTRRLIGSIKNAVNGIGDDDFRWYIDYGPMLERAYAARAGLGYIAKNSMLINREYGSWIFLSEILTSLKLEPDNPYSVDHGECGLCRMCILSCPTGAIVDDGVIDANKCISYLTIERPKQVPEELALKMTNRFFGCDICQDVCPKNKNAAVTTHDEFLRGGIGEFVNALSVDSMETRKDFLDLAAGTPLTRPRLEGLKRNADIVLANGRKDKQHKRKSEKINKRI